MESKLLEIRDAATFIPALAVKISGADGYLARRAGFGEPMIYLVHLTGEKAHYDPYSWDNRTMQAAHSYIMGYWNSLRQGDVIDVQFILGETSVKKNTEAWGQ